MNRQSLCLTIADLTFQISAALPLRHEDPQHAYDAFLSAGRPGPDTVALPVRLDVGPFTPPAGWRRIFESGRTWRLFTDDAARYIVRTVSGMPDPLWVARLPRDLSGVTVTCSERLVSDADGGRTLANPVRYPLDQLLTLYVLARHGGLILHAAGAVLNGRALVFPGKSGAGKSTLARCLAGRPEFRLLSDDRIVARTPGPPAVSIAAHGTPWPGDAGIARNAGAPLAALFFLEHGRSNTIRELRRDQALERLLPAASVPWHDRETLPAVLDFADQLLARTPAFAFAFTPVHAAAESVLDWSRAHQPS
ncbi:MAG: hypothetical protein JXR37_06975 [Kiritimatiellae bacterium]|nr:hypothetical protein [Kiritimatiellia bacterium]